MQHTGPGEEQTPATPAWPKPVRWTAAEMIFVLFFASMLWIGACTEGLRVTGFYSWFYGLDAVILVSQPSPESLTQAGAMTSGATLSPAGAPLAGIALNAALPLTSAPELGTPLRSAQRIMQLRFQLWSVVLSVFFQIATVLIVFRLASGTTPADLGLTSNRPITEFLLGLGAAAVLTPVVGVINLGVQELWKLWYSSGVQEHPFKQLGEHSLSPVEWTLLGMSAVVAAPVWEELMFRGVLQPWFLTRPHGGRIAVGVAFLWALSVCGNRIWAARLVGPAITLAESLPVLTVLMTVPVLVFLEQHSQNRVAPGIFGTAVLFAWFHAAVWPSPIPLLVLALALGWLAYRTRSLVAPITVHALFNGASFVLLLLETAGK